MEKTVFRVDEMDCPSEEQMIRMKLMDNMSVKQLSFDLDNRELTVIHTKDINKIAAAIDSLNLGAHLIETVEYLEDISDENNTIDKKLLYTVLLINFAFFIIEILFGFLSKSMGLVADSMDMLADAFVYGLSIYAITGTMAAKRKIAGISGIFQILLAILGFAEVFRRFISLETIPNPYTMIIVSIFALIANLISLIVLNKSRSKEIHIKSSQIFTSNDIIANTGVILAGVLVFLLDSKIPDLIIGIVVFSLVLRGAIRILKLAKN